MSLITLGYVNLVAMPPCRVPKVKLVTMVRRETEVLLGSKEGVVPRDSRAEQVDQDLRDHPDSVDFL